MQTYNGQTLSVSLSVELTQQLKQLSQKANVTLFTSLFSAFSLLLSRYSGQEDIAIGTPTAGRTQLEIEELIGFFVNTLVLRSDLSGQPDFYTLLKRNHQMTLAAYDHQDTPFEKVVDALVKERDISRSPLFQVMFILQNMTQTPWNLPHVEVIPIITEYCSAKFDLTLALGEHDNQIQGSIVYNTDLYKAETIEQLWQHFLVLLQNIVAQPELPVAALPILTQDEQQKILVDWNATQTDYPKDKTLQQLFEAQVERTPENIAATFENQSLTYRELNAKANQLAHYLRAQYQLQQGEALPPDTLIAIAVERSLEMIIGILGILKAGAAYVPIILTILHIVLNLCCRTVKLNMF